jgi:hypothetical protein
MPSLTANDLKTRGIAAIESMLANQPDAMLSVRGQDRFVVMHLDHYHYLRECELDAALAQSQADMAAGRFARESAQAHMERLTNPTKQQAAAKPKAPKVIKAAKVPA